MKNLATIGSLVLIITFSGCVKNPDSTSPSSPTPTPTPTPVNNARPIEGIWIGSYTITEVPSQGALSYNFFIKPGGILTTEGMGGDGKKYFATGSWSKTGNNFSFTYSTKDSFGNDVVASGTATFDSTGILKNGVWHDITAPFHSGTFPTMNRDPNPPTSSASAAKPIEGIWLGSYTITQVPSQGALPYNFFIKPGGSLTTEGMGGDGKKYFATGTWSKTGNNLSITYVTKDSYGNNITATGSATFDSTGILKNGVWQNVSPAGNTGTFPVMNRVN